MVGLVAAGAVAMGAGAGVAAEAAGVVAAVAFLPDGTLEAV